MSPLGSTCMTSSSPISVVNIKKFLMEITASDWLFRLNSRCFACHSDVVCFVPGFTVLHQLTIIIQRDNTNQVVHSVTVMMTRGVVLPGLEPGTFSLQATALMVAHTVDTLMIC